MEDRITVNNAGKYEADVITGAKINIENGFKMPPVKKSKTPSCKVSNNKYRKAFVLDIVLLFLSSNRE